MVPPANEIIEIEDTVPYGDDAQQTLDLPNPEGAAVEAARLAAEKEKQEATPQDIFMKGPLVDLEESSKVCVTGLSGGGEEFWSVRSVSSSAPEGPGVVEI